MPLPEWSEWSEFNFHTTPIVPVLLLSPLNGSIALLPFQFSWGMSLDPEVDLYLLELATDIDFINIQQIAVLSDTSIILPIEPDILFYWRVSYARGPKPAPIP